MILLTAALIVAQAAAPSPSPSPAGPIATVETSLGRIRIALDQERAPISVANFAKYARSGHYAGTVFHRVIPGFMIQGGGMTAELQEKPTSPPIRNEARNGVRNTRGSIAMARTILTKSPTAIRMLKFAFNAVDDGMVGQQVFAGEATRLAYGTDEAVEGRDAFLEKRDPDWSPFPWYF